MRIMRFLSGKLLSYKKRMKRCLESALERLFHGGMFSLVMITLVWIAVFLYVVFYYTYVPAPSYTRPIHLQIESCDDSSKDCPFPSAHVRLTKRQQLLMMGQQYKFYVQLEMPESPVNKQLGMFMVCITLKDKSGFLTSQSCRSNMLHYYSDFLYTARVILFSPLYIFGAKEEKQTLTFELYSDYEEDQNHPVTDVYIELRTHNAEIYSANLFINANLKGMRYFMYYWPITSAILGISFNLCVVFFTTSLSFYNNFFVDTVPVQIVRSHIRKLEAQTDKILQEYSLSSSNFFVVIRLILADVFGKICNYFKSINIYFAIEEETPGEQDGIIKSDTTDDEMKPFVMSDIVCGVDSDEKLASTE